MRIAKGMGFPTLPGQGALKDHHVRTEMDCRHSCPRRRPEAQSGLHEGTERVGRFRATTRPAQSRLVRRCQVLFVASREPIESVSSKNGSRVGSLSSQKCIFAGSGLPTMEVATVISTALQMQLNVTDQRRFILRRRPLAAAGISLNFSARAEWLTFSVTVSQG